MAASASGQIVDDFETSFQACLAALTNPDHFNVRDSEETKTGVEQTIQRFLDVAKQMECFFLQKRLLLSVQKPEHIILENISELKNELIRKEQLLNKYNEKIQTWQNLLQDVPGTPRPSQPQVQPQQQQQQPPPPQNIQALQGPPMQPTVMTPQGPVAQHHIMQQHLPPMGSAQVAGGMQGGMVMPPQQLHPQQHMGAAQQQGGPGGLQGPLAYLERTMSNIGMPDPNR